MVMGFRSEVVTEAATLSNVILFDGKELALILGGRWSLIEALRIKLDKALDRLRGAEAGRARQALPARASGAR